MIENKSIEKMEKVVAHDPSIGYVTKESRTPRRATGTFVPPIEGLTPRRSPRLLAKRHQSEAAISTPVREAVRKAVRLRSMEMFDYFTSVVSQYSHLKSSSVKASANNKLTNYVIVTRSTIIDDGCIGPHDAVGLIMCEDGKFKFMVYEHLFKEGTMQVTLTNPELQSVLGEMNDSCWSVCRGVCN